MRGNGVRGRSYGALVETRVKYEYIGDDAAAAVAVLSELCDLANVLEHHVAAVLPDRDTWTITVTGDLVATSNAIEGRHSEGRYTIERGAGQVGARMIEHHDGTFSMVISTAAILETRHELTTADEVIGHALRSAAHLARHEAGHAALALRGEDSSKYQDSVNVTGAERMWRRHLAAHMDDYRIEAMTRRDAPSPLSQVDHLEDAIGHLRAELNASCASWRQDIQAARDRTMIAANSLLRVVAYLAAELGTGGNVARRPAEACVGWDQYLEASWDAWSLTFARLSAADEPMPLDEIAVVLNDLCWLTIAWLRSIGVDYGMDDGQGEYIYWRQDSY